MGCGVSFQLAVESGIASWKLTPLASRIPDEERRSMLTRKERFLTAVHGRQPDRVPMFDFLFQQPMYEALIGHRPRDKRCQGTKEGTKGVRNQFNVFGS